MKAHLEWDVPEVLRNGDMRYGRSFQQFGDPFEGRCSVKDMGGGVCVITALAGDLDREARDAILSECAGHGFLIARFTRVKNWRVQNWEYDLTARPFKARHGVDR